MGELDFTWLPGSENPAAEEERSIFSTSNSPQPRRPNESSYLRAASNVSYIQFLHLVGYWWNQSHPDVRMYISSTDKTISVNLNSPNVGPNGSFDIPGWNVDADLNIDSYPRIVAALETRRPMQMEPKPRIRETIWSGPDGDFDVDIKAQRFQSIISFTVVDRIQTNYPPESRCTDPDYFRENVLECSKYDMVSAADEIIEALEEFMLQVTPVFKELGVSELVYARRLPDATEIRSGYGIAKRAVAYTLTIEKVYRGLEQWKIKEFVTEARLLTGNSDLSATPTDIDYTNNLLDSAG